MDVEAAYQYCETLAKTHYENFPVASILLPPAMRRAVAVIYTFAREADDFADEGSLTEAQRLSLLQNFWQALENLNNAAAAAVTTPVFIALQDVLQRYPNLPITLFFDLLTAFKQDVTQSAYAHFGEVLDYCQHSANPIGRLMLHLSGHDSPQNLADSDKICTALQLINFYQDLKSDLQERDRCYLPLDEMQQFQVTLAELKLGQDTPLIKALLAQQVARASAMLSTGAGLGNRLPGLFGLEIRIIIQGGMQIVQALARRNSVYERPTLKIWHWLTMLWNALKKA